MTMMYYTLPGGEPIANLRTLLPHIINPERLSDDELVEHGIARCAVTRPALEWWQQQGARQIDTSRVPHVVAWVVEDLSPETAKELAWQRVKAERNERQSGLMPYLYPSGDTHHNQMTDKVKSDLTASTTGAIALNAAGVVDPVMPWTVFENITHMLTPAQMIEFGVAALQWRGAIHVQSQVMRAAINAAQTVADVVAAVQWGE
ncbi:hypothetical protein [Thauera sp.]|uniref:DUF4376 domain-containing protein n=1 Tax=Thauera sp. TaxID=1905334 RepID=UPI0039E3BE50